MDVFAWYVVGEYVLWKIFWIGFVVQMKIRDSISCFSCAGPSAGGRRESISSVDMHLSTVTGIEQDTRVLTLAEQIIAAIPDRIKVYKSFALLYSLVHHFL